MTTFVNIDRAQVIQLIELFVYSVGSAHFKLSRDDYHRELLSDQIRALTALAEDIGHDLWSITAQPYDTELDIPMAAILRRVNVRYGAAGKCAMNGCHYRVSRLSHRPSELPRGTRWPTCPELCALHAQARHTILRQRVAQVLPKHDGPVSAGAMPLPEFAKFAPGLDELREVEILCLF